MLSLENRALAVFVKAWRLLPEIKYEALISSIKLEDLQALHGNYNLDSGVLTFSTRLFWGDNPSQIRMIDINGDDPPLVTPFVSRGLHTAVHEFSHAIGAATGLDSSKEWRDLSGFVEAPDDPQDTARYFENRIGWPPGFSDWRHRAGTWFVRPYAEFSPFEDFADCVAHVAIGWFSDVVTPSGIAKMNYILRHVWQQKGIASMAASAERWAKRLQIA